MTTPVNKMEALMEHLLTNKPNGETVEGVNASILMPHGQVAGRVKKSPVEGVYEMVTQMETGDHKVKPAKCYFTSAVILSVVVPVEDSRIVSGALGGPFG